MSRSIGGVIAIATAIAGDAAIAMADGGIGVIAIGGGTIAAIANSGQIEGASCRRPFFLPAASSLKPIQPSRLDEIGMLPAAAMLLVIEPDDNRRHLTAPVNAAHPIAAGCATRLSRIPAAELFVPQSHALPSAGINNHHMADKYDMARAAAAWPKWKDASVLSMRSLASDGARPKRTFSGYRREEFRAGKIKPWV